ncbi:MAG: diguanylate cyclase [Cyanobacteria bacterium P01_A01_bin.83]
MMIDDKAKILIVDDQPDNVELLSTILTAQGYELKESDSGSSAIAMVKADPPDLILLDISMPMMDGFEVCKILKSNHNTQDIPIIFISALKEVRDKTQAFKFGGSDYITKPFYIEEVLARVKNQVENYRLKTELQATNIRLKEENHKLKEAEDKLLILNQKLSKLATLDGLTKVANRYRFDEFLIREWQRGQRENFPLSLILADIDYFKLYNDHFGHQAGDSCLESVAQAISKTFNRPADLVARYGGEEFAVILPRTPTKNALLLAQKIRSAIQELNLPHPESSVSNIVSLSLGVASVIPSSQYTIKQLLVTADKALYQAKKQGRDRAILKLLD